MKKFWIEVLHRDGLITRHGSSFLNERYAWAEAKRLQASGEIKDAQLVRVVEERK